MNLFLSMLVSLAACFLIAARWHLSWGFWDWAVVSAMAYPFVWAARNFVGWLAKGLWNSKVVRLAAALGVIAAFLFLLSPYWTYLTLVGVVLLAAAGLPVRRGGLAQEGESSASDADVSSHVSLVHTGSPTGPEKPNALVRVYDALIEARTIARERQTQEELLKFLKVNEAVRNACRDILASQKAFDRASLEETRKDTEAETAHENARIEHEIAKATATFRIHEKTAEAQAQALLQQQRLENLQHPPVPEAKSSPEEQKAQRHGASAARLSRLETEIAKARKIANPDERVRKENVLEDEKQRELQEWTRTLP